MKKLTNILLFLFAIGGTTNAGNVNSNLSARDCLISPIEQKIVEENKKRLTYLLIPETEERGMTLKVKTGKITYFSKNENFLLFLESSLTKTGDYFKINYNKRNLKFSFSTEFNFINLSNLMRRGDSPFVKPQIIINSKFELYLPF